MTDIGFIGVGQMGKLMIEHLINASYTVYANDLNKDALDYVSKKGAISSPSISELATKSDVVILMLPNSDIVESVITGPEGLLNKMDKGKVIIDMSSSHLKSTVKLSKLAEEKGIIFVDAPVSGGKKKAADASLTIMCGGEEVHVSKLLPLLKVMGEKVIHVGDIGHGHALKALNNYLSATSLYASAEAMMIAEAIGLDLEKSLEVINGSSGQSYSTEYKMPNFILNRNFNTGFALNLMSKDVKMANILAQDHNIPVMLGALVEQIYKSATTVLNEHSDHTEVIKFLELLSGHIINAENKLID